MSVIRFLFAAMIAALFLVTEASAHQVSLSYISVTEQDGEQRAKVTMSFLDLEVANGIDQDFDSAITWGEAKASLDRITTYVLARTSLDAGGPCTLRRQAAQPIQQSGEGFLSLTFDVDCPDAKAPMRVASTIFLEIDPTSRMLVSTRNASGDRTYVLGIEDTRAADAAPEGEVRAVGLEANKEESLLSYFLEGVSHLFGGPDHMLFLLVLIIPAINAGGGFRGVAVAALLPITGFTVGHALTLTAAASGLVRPPAQLVEILIAVTILLTAIDNVRPYIPGPRSVVAFIFGLIHGFGFASALGALEVTGWQMGVALLGFNLGIEAGQALLVLAVAPLLFLIREPARRVHIMPLGLSVLASGIAIFWVVERTGVL